MRSGPVRLLIRDLAGRPLPPHIHAGTTLTEEDDLEIRTLLARRDKQIQFLYERELEWTMNLE